MIRQIAVAASIALLGMSGQAMAAQTVKLGNVQGSVLVNQNGRYVPVKGPTTLRTGDRVMAMDGGASLTFADGCNISIAARSMATIGEGSPCGGSAGIVRVATQYDDVSDDDDSNADLLLWGAFGVITVLVVGAALADDEKPTSP